MKLICNFMALLTASAIFFSCKPEVKPIQLSSSTFCPCSTVPFFYQVDGASNAQVIISPQSALEAGATIPTLITNDGSMHQAFVKICSNATITVRATNSHGTSEQSASVTAFTGNTQNVSFSADCSSGSFRGWFFTPTLEGLPENASIRSFVFRSDRAGVLSNTSNGISVNIPGPGTHVITDFINARYFGGSYLFNASLLANERCVTAGSTLPAGTVAPPDQSAAIELGCLPR